MAVHAWGSSFGAIFAGLAAAVLVSLILSLLLGLLSLRVKAIFFALVTLAVAFALLSLITQLYTFTGGEDGLRVQVPRALGERKSTRLNSSYSCASRMSSYS